MFFPNKRAEKLHSFDCVRIFLIILPSIAVIEINCFQLTSAPHTTNNDDANYLNSHKLNSSEDRKTWKCKALGKRSGCVNVNYANYYIIYLE